MALKYGHQPYPQQTNRKKSKKYLKCEYIKDHNRHNENNVLTHCASGNLSHDIPSTVFLFHWRYKYSNYFS